MAFGAGKAAIAEVLKGQVPVDFEVWPENAEAFSVLRAMQTQVLTRGMSGTVYGLNYAVLPWVMTQCGIAEANAAEVFFKVQIAEAEMVSFLTA